MTPETILIYVIKGLYGLLMVVLGWAWNKQEKKLSHQEDRINQIEKAHRDFITHTEAKAMIAEIIEPLKIQHIETRNDLKNLLGAVQQIQTDLAVQSALYKLHNQAKQEN